MTVAQEDFVALYEGWQKEADTRDDSVSEIIREQVESLPFEKIQEWATLLDQLGGATGPLVLVLSPLPGSNSDQVLREYVREVACQYACPLEEGRERARELLSHSDHERGASLVEYAILLFLIAAVVIVVVTLS